MSEGVSVHSLYTIYTPQDIRVGGWDRTVAEPSGSTQAETQEGDRQKDQTRGEKTGILEYGCNVRCGCIREVYYTCTLGPISWPL